MRHARVRDTTAPADLLLGSCAGSNYCFYAIQRKCHPAANITPLLRPARMLSLATHNFVTRG